MASIPSLCGKSGTRRLITEAFGPLAKVVSSTDVAGGRGTFSDVLQLIVDPGPTPTSLPTTVVAKLPTTNRNREAARASGAYERELAAYTELLPGSPVRHPSLYAATAENGLAAFLLEDLTPLRRVDQVSGLEAADATNIATALATFHHHWRNKLSQPDNKPDKIGIRRSTVSGFTNAALQAGVEALHTHWGELDAALVQAFTDLVANADSVIATFTATGQSDGPNDGAVTLCHGDPRADNLAFAKDGTPVLFDWQQLAIQFGEADLAWLAATSLDPDTRRNLDDKLLETYQGQQDRYRLGFVLPGLAALYLAQRQADHEATKRFIMTSLSRIGTALVDHEVATIK